MSDDIRKFFDCLKQHTDAGAVLMFDGELLDNPRWRIGKHTVSVTCGRSTYRLREPGDDDREVLSDLRPRIRALVDAT